MNPRIAARAERAPITIPAIAPGDFFFPFPFPFDFPDLGFVDWLELFGLVFDVELLVVVDFVGQPSAGLLFAHPSIG
jgi:hypothetical protein